MNDKSHLTHFATHCTERVVRSIVSFGLRKTSRNSISRKIHHIYWNCQLSYKNRRVKTLLR